MGDGVGAGVVHGKLVVVEAALLFFHVEARGGLWDGEITRGEDEGGRHEPASEHVHGVDLQGAGGFADRGILPGVGGVEDAAGFGLEPADEVGLVSGEDAEAGGFVGVVGDNGLVAEHVHGIEGQWEVHDDGGALANAEVVHHLGGSDTGDFGVEKAGGCFERGDWDCGWVRCGYD